MNLGRAKIGGAECGHIAIITTALRLLIHDKKPEITMVRISSRTWTLAQIEHLTVLIAAGSTAENAAIVLRRSVMVVRAKARNLRMQFARDLG
jgi:hypothetical protein